MPACLNGCSRFTTSTSQIKHRSAKLPVAVRQLYAMLLFGSTTLPDIAAAFKSMPSINLVISNMRGPQGQRYLAGAPMVSFQGCPIVPPGAGLNVSFVSVNDMICLGVGAAPEAVADPYQLTELILAALADLEKIALPGKAGSKKATAEKREIQRQKTGTRKSTAKTRRKKARAKASVELETSTRGYNMNINLGLHLTQRAGLSRDLEAYVEPSTDTRLSYAELNALVNRCCSVLADLGLEPGDRAALLMQNCVEFVALFYAAAKLGVVVVPLNTRLTASELSFILSDSGAKALFYGAECGELTSGIKANEDHPLGITTWVQVRAAAGDNQGLEALLEKAADSEPDVVHGGDDNLFIMYTSGTTGLPKGVVHTHETISWAALSWVTTMDVRYRDRLLLPLPMFHVAALTSVISSAVGGATIVSMPNFDPMTVWALIREERVTTGGSVPAILNFMRQVPDFATFDSEHFRCFITGAAPMPKALIEIYNEKSMQVVQGYALTETGGGGTFLLNEYALSKIGSAGAPAMFYEVRVRDREGNISSPGHRGGGYQGAFRDEGVLEPPGCHRRNL